ALPISTLTRNLLDIASRSGNYLLNIGPDRRGAGPAGAADRAREMGARRGPAGAGAAGPGGARRGEGGAGVGPGGQGAAVHNAGVAGNVADPAWGAVSRSGGKLYASVYTWPGAGKALHLAARAPFTITGARVLGSSQRGTWQAGGDGYDITPQGNATNPIATVIQLDYTAPVAPAGTGTGLSAQY